MAEGEVILIVEDDADQRLTVEDILLAKGYQPIGVGSGGEALNRLREGGVDLLLIDLRLPDMDGMEVLRLSKSLQPELDAILVTGYATLENAIQAVNLGAFAYSTKPVDFRHLILLIGRALERHHLRQIVAQREREVQAHVEFHIKVLNERIQYLEEATQRGERLSRIYKMITLASKAQSPLEVASEFLQLLQEELGAEYASLTLVNPNGTPGERADSFRGIEPFTVSHRPGGLGEQTLKNRQPQYIADTSTDPRANPALVQAGFRSYLGLPLLAESQVAGILFIHSTRTGAFQQEQDFLEVIASGLGIILHKAQLLARVEQAKQEWETTFDAIGDGIGVMDEERRIIRANQAFAQLVGKPVTELTGKKICLLIQGKEEPHPDCPLEKVLADGQPHEIPLEEPHLENKLLLASIYPIPSAPGEPRRFVHLTKVLGA